MRESVLFTKTQTRLLNELKRQYEQAWFQQLNSTLDVIYEELGLTEKAKGGKHRLTLQPGFAGVDVQNTEPTPEIPGNKE
jgi:hypothetical protein